MLIPLYPISSSWNIWKDLLVTWLNSCSMPGKTNNHEPLVESVVSLKGNVLCDTRGKKR